MKIGLILLFGILLISFASATSVGVYDSDFTEGKVIYVKPESPINYSLVPTVNNTEHFGGYTVTTLTTYLQGLYDLIYCELTGCTMDGAIDMGNNDIDNINDVEINDYLEVGGISDFVGVATFYDGLDSYGSSNFYNNLYIYNETEAVFLELETENTSEGVQIRLLADGTNDLYIYTYGSTAEGTYYGLPRAGSSYVDAQGERFILGTFDSSPMYLSTHQDPRFILTSDGDLIPFDDEYYDIGNSSNRIRDIYILGEDGDGGIHFVEDDGSYGNLSMDDDLNLLWNGNIIGNSSFNETYISDNFAPISEPLSLHLNQDNWFNDSNGWINWDGDSNEFNVSMLDTTFYNATSYAIVDSAGTLNAGTLADTQHPDANYDGVTMNFSTRATAPALDLRFNITDGLDSFSQILIRYKTSNLIGLFPVVQLWNYDNSNWDDYGFLSQTLTFDIYQKTIYDSQEHIEDGVVQLRVYKAGTGNSNNKFYFDWIAISKGYGTGTGTERDPNFNTWLNLPIFEHNVNATNVNATFDTYFGNGSQLTGLPETDLTGYAKYQFEDNNFNGSGNFTTTSDITAGGVYNLAETTATAGKIVQGGVTIFHTYEPEGVTQNNIFLGKNSGNTNIDNAGTAYKGTGNVGIGPLTLTNLDTGYYNFGMGNLALYSLTDGNGNIAIGNNAGRYITWASSNTLIGRNSGYDLTGGGHNTGIGTFSLGNTATNTQDSVAIGYYAGFNSVGMRNLFLGSWAGIDETGSDTFLVDNADRTSEALSRSKSLIYGLFEGHASGPYLQFNADVNVTGELDVGETTVNGGATRALTVKQGGNSAGIRLTHPSIGSNYFDLEINGDGKGVFQIYKGSMQFDSISANTDIIFSPARWGFFKLEDSAGVGQFQVRNSGNDVLFVVDSLGNVTLSGGNISGVDSISTGSLTATSDITMQGHLLTLGDVGQAVDTVIDILGSTNSATIIYNESLDIINLGTTGTSIKIDRTRWDGSTIGLDYPLSDVRTALVTLDGSTITRNKWTNDLHIELSAPEVQIPYLNIGYGLFDDTRFTMEGGDSTLTKGWDSDKFVTTGTGDAYYWALNGFSDIRFGGGSLLSIDTLTADNLIGGTYVKGENLITGSNTIGGLASGDINVSDIYYDFLQPKSPAITCSDDWCSVSFPKYQKTLWIQTDDEWNILDIVYNNQSYTRQTFWELVSGTQYEDLALKLNKKLDEAHDKKVCNNQDGYIKDDGLCYQEIETSSTYEDSITTIQVSIMQTENSTCTELDRETLMVVEYDCEIQTETIETEDKIVFKDNCDWNEEDGYYCIEENLLL